MKIFILMTSLLLSFTSLAQPQVNQEVIKEVTKEGIAETFGGSGVQIFIFEDFSARLEFECATGLVQAGRWPTGQSRIAANGLYIPIKLQREEKASFKANIDVSTGKMSLAVKVGSKRALNYKLIRGQNSELKRCR